MLDINSIFNKLEDLPLFIERNGSSIWTQANQIDQQVGFELNAFVLVNDIRPFWVVVAGRNQGLRLSCALQRKVSGIRSHSSNKWWNVTRIGFGILSFNLLSWDSHELRFSSFGGHVQRCPRRILFLQDRLQVTSPCHRQNQKCSSAAAIASQ